MSPSAATQIPGGFAAAPPSAAAPQSLASVPGGAFETPGAITGTALSPTELANKMGGGFGQNSGIAPIEAPPSFLDKLKGGAESVFGFADKHPQASAMMLQTGAAMFSPDQLDLMREDEKREERNRARIRQNMLVGGIDLGVRGSGNPLTTTSGSPYKRNPLI
jgi:hypothetical protein